MRASIALATAWLCTLGPAWGQTPITPTPIAPTPITPTPITPTPIGPTPITPTPITPTPIGPTPITPTPIGSSPSPPSVPSGVDPGAAHSISLVIEDGTGQDFVHAQYKPGSQLHLGADVRDGLGRSIGPTAGCTPDWKLENDIAPNGKRRADLVGNVIRFLEEPGAFSVSAFCRENPQITSAGWNEGPFNFETSNGRFARANAGALPTPPAPAPAPPPTPEAAKPGAKGGSGLLGLALAGLVGYGVYELVKPADAGSDCSCSCNFNPDITCTAQTVCPSSDGVPGACGCPQGGGCDGHGNAARIASGSSGIRNVRDLVAFGFAHQHDDDRRFDGGQPALAHVEMVGRPRCELLAPARAQRPVAIEGSVATDHRLIKIDRSSLVPRDARDDQRADDSRRRRSTISASLPAVAVSNAPHFQAATPVSTAVVASDQRQGGGGRWPEITAAQFGSAVAVAVSAYAWISWLRGHARKEAPGARLIPWVERDAGGFNVAGHF